MKGIILLYVFVYAAVLTAFGFTYNLAQGSLLEPMLDGLTLSFLPASFVWLWYALEINRLKMPLPKKIDESYGTLPIIAVLMIFCIVRAEITGGFADSYYAIEEMRPDAVSNMFKILGPPIGLIAFITSWRRLRRIKRESSSEEDEESSRNFY